MHRLCLALLVAVTMTGSALAQGVPQQSMRGPVPSQSRGITVSGSSIVRTTATSATLRLQIGGPNNTMTIDAKALEPVVDALVQAGVPRANITLPPNLSGPGYSNAATVFATVDAPSVEMMKRGIVTVGTAIVANRTLRLYGAQVDLRNANCADAVARARSEALKSARTKALAIAHELGVGLGGVLSVNSNDQLSTDGSCVTQYYVDQTGAPRFNFGTAGTAPTDEDYITVPVSSFASLTYAIK